MTYALGTPCVDPAKVAEGLAECARTLAVNYMHGYIKHVEYRTAMDDLWFRAAQQGVTTRVMKLLDPLSPVRGE